MRPIMKPIIISSLAVSVLLAQSAFAKNLGILSENDQPRSLIPANEFVTRSSSSHGHGLRSDAYNGGNSGYGGYNSGHGNSYGGGYGNSYGGYGNGYGGYGGYGNGYDYDNGYGNYYGGYGNGYGYGGYGNGYGYDNSYYYYPSNTYPTYYYANDLIPDSSSTSPSHSQLSGLRADSATNLSNASVVCFSSDSEGNWFASADTSRNAVSTQEGVNHECLANGADCNQNLGCAVAIKDS